MWSVHAVLKNSNNWSLITVSAKKPNLSAIRTKTYSRVDCRTTYCCDNLYSSDLPSAHPAVCVPWAELRRRNRSANTRSCPDGNCREVSGVFCNQKVFAEHVLWPLSGQESPANRPAVRKYAWRSTNDRICEKAGNNGTIPPCIFINYLIKIIQIVWMSNPMCDFSDLSYIFY